MKIFKQKTDEFGNLLNFNGKPNPSFQDEKKALEQLVKENNKKKGEVKMNKKGYIEGFDIFMICIIIFLIIGLPTLMFYLDKQECKQNAEMMEIDWEWGIVKGCLWDIENKWINSDNYILNQPVYTSVLKENVK